MQSISEVHEPLYSDDKRSTNLKYPLKLKCSSYDAPPLDDITIEEFESCALDRLRVLAEIESSLARNRTQEDLFTVIRGVYRKYLPLDSSTADSQDLDGQRRKDHIGHFVLRLAFCRSEDLRRRFIAAETTLFKIRFQDADCVSTADKALFFKSRHANWAEVGREEREHYRSELLSLFRPTNPKVDISAKEEEFAKERYFKVRWTRVPDLVGTRRVFLHKGWAFVPGREQLSIVFEEFEQQLAQALELTARALPRLDEDSRLVPILNNLSGGFLAGISSGWSSTGDQAKNGEITANMIDELAKQSFPLCMRTLHDNLRRDHHLKHFGRLQYGLFLKVLGLSIDEAIAFWRKSFDRITDDKFNKEYKYNIRHSYGLEGKRANYPAKSCQQILTSAPSETCCPYRHYTPENLQTVLLSSYSSQGLTGSDLPQIMTIVKAGHHHVACTRVFEITHASCGVKEGQGAGGGESIIHPNQYAARSIELRRETLKGESEMRVD
ncbi:hypothetical protein AX16_003644 [Volvariella volvacea WC 439]|nr:hypothetical protein AX16_003644 [Volvariella volvacea WC 439]